MMAAKAIKCSEGATDGIAAGKRLSERVPHVLLHEYANRKVGQESEAEKRFSAVCDELRSVLGVVSSNDPQVAAVLHRLDGAVWDVAADHEDRAWHAAWTTAMALRGC